MRRHISCVTIAILLFQSFVMAQSPAGPSAAAPTPSIDDVLGKWRSEEGDYFDIKLLEPYDKGRCASRPCGISLLGKHDWGGSFYFTGALVFNIAPPFSAMNQDIPEWARKQVEGQLRWELNLKYEEQCEDSVLTGSWYPGEVQWTEEKSPDGGNVTKQEARVVGKGIPRKVVFYKVGDEGSDVDLSGAPVILVRLVQQPPSDDPEQLLSSVTKTDPFFVDLHMDPDDAKKAGGTVTIRIRAVKSGKSASLKLHANPPREHVVVYTTDKPVRVARKRGDSGDPDAPDLWYDTFPNKIQNGDTIVVSYEGGDVKAKTEFSVYDSRLWQAIARNEKALLMLNDIYQAALLSETSPQAREALHKKIQMIANARQLINDYQPGNTENFTELTRVEIGLSYLQDLLNQDPQRLGDIFSGNFPGDGIRYVHGAYKTNWAYPYEAKYIDGVIAEVSRKNQEQVMRTLGDLSVDVYQLSLTDPPFAMAEKFIVTVWGIDATGQRIDKTDRVLAGIGLASDLLYLGAQTAQRFQKYRALDKQTFSGSFSNRLMLGGSGAKVDVAPKPANVTRTLTQWPGETDWVDPQVRAPYQSSGTPLQSGVNTCGINVGDGMLRDLNLEPRPVEKYSLRLAWQQGFYDVGIVHAAGYIEGGGMNPDQMRKYLNFRGAKAGIYTGAQPPSVARFKQWFAAKNRKIALLVNGGTPQERALHWVRLEGIECGTNGKPEAIYGDPWNGKSWRIPAEVLRRRIHSVVIAK